MRQRSLPVWPAPHAEASEVVQPLLGTPGSQSGSASSLGSSTQLSGPLQLCAPVASRGNVGRELNFTGLEPSMANNAALPAISGQPATAQLATGSCAGAGSAGAHCAAASAHQSIVTCKPIGASADSSAALQAWDSSEGEASSSHALQPLLSTSARQQSDAAHAPHTCKQQHPVPHDAVNARLQQAPQQLAPPQSGSYSIPGSKQRHHSKAPDSAKQATRQSMQPGFVCSSVQHSGIKHKAERHLEASQPGSRLQRLVQFAVYGFPFGRRFTFSDGSVIPIDWDLRL